MLGLLFAAGCMHSRPDAPAVPVGPDSVEVDSAYTYKTSASNGKQYGLVYVRFDWGDVDTSPWSGHGETFELAHSWRDGGVYAVRAQARDDRADFSEWSAPRSVTAVVPPYPYRLVDSVAVPDAPLIETHVSPDGKFIYVARDYDASLSVVRTSDLRVVAQIPFYCSWWGRTGGGGGGRMVCSPDGEYVYATLYRGDYIAAIRTADEVVVDSLFLGEQYLDMPSIAISPDGRRLFVPAYADSGFIIVVRLPDFVVEDTIFMPGMEVYVTAMSVSPDGTRLHAANPGDDCVFSIRLSDHTVEWQVPARVHDAPGALVLHPTGSPLYVLEGERISVRESGTGSLIDTIPLSSSWSVDIAPDGSFLYVTCSVDDSIGALAVVRISDNKVVRFITIPGGVCDVAPSPDGRHLYAAGDHALYVLSR